MRKWSLAAAAAVMAMACGSASAGKFDASVVILNKSSWDIHQLYLSSTETEEWGPDQLGDKVIGTGESFTLHSIPCDSYDVRLVDEDGDECVVGGVDMCNDTGKWIISDEDLLTCQAATDQ